MFLSAQNYYFKEFFNITVQMPNYKNLTVSFYKAKNGHEVSSVIEVPHLDNLLSHCKEVQKSILDGLGKRNVQTEKPSTFELKKH